MMNGDISTVDSFNNGGKNSRPRFVNLNQKAQFLDMVADPEALEKYIDSLDSSTKEGSEEISDLLDFCDALIIEEGVSPEEKTHNVKAVKIFLSQPDISQKIQKAIRSIPDIGGKFFALLEREEMSDSVPALVMRLSDLSKEIIDDELADLKKCSPEERLQVLQANRGGNIAGIIAMTLGSSGGSFKYEGSASEDTVLELINSEEFSLEDRAELLRETGSTVMEYCENTVNSILKIIKTSGFTGRQQARILEGQSVVQKLLRYGSPDTIDGIVDLVRSDDFAAVSPRQKHVIMKSVCGRQGEKMHGKGNKPTLFDIVPKKYSWEDLNSYKEEYNHKQEIVQDAYILYKNLFEDSQYNDDKFCLGSMFHKKIQPVDLFFEEFYQSKKDCIHINPDDLPQRASEIN